MTDKANSPKLEGMAAVEAAMKERRYPPVHLWNPDYCGPMDLRIARDGTWFYMGTPILRPALVKLFASILKREGDDYFLVTPVEKVSIMVDVAPLHVVDMQIESTGGGQKISFRTLTDDHLIVDADHPIKVSTNAVTGEPTPLVHVRAGLDALIGRSLFYQLVDMAVLQDDGKTLAVRSCGQLFPLGEII